MPRLDPQIKRNPSQRGDPLAQQFWHELVDEVLILEERTGQWLLQAADPTRLGWLKLNLRLETGERQLLVGEVASDQELRCMGCGEELTVEGTITLGLCDNCGCGYYQATPVEH